MFNYLHTCDSYKSTSVYSRSSHNAVDEQGILDRKKGVDEIYPNIWQYTDDTVANLERELMVECQNADLLDNLLADLR